MTTKQKPVHNITLGRVRAAIWANSTKDNGTIFNVTVTRSYRVGDTWKQTSSFGRDELLLALKVMDQAHTWICEQRKQPAAAA